MNTKEVNITDLKVALVSLMKAKQTIKGWHDLNHRYPESTSTEGLWNIYDEHSPEMQIVNKGIEILKKLIKEAYVDPGNWKKK